MDELKQQPIEEKKSRNLGFKDYFKDQLAWSLLIPTAGLAGYAIGKKFKVPPLDGSPMITQKIYEKFIGTATEKMVGEKMEIEEIERLAPLTKGFPESERLEATHSIWNSLKSMEVAAIPFVYHMWRKREKNEVELKDVHEKLQDLPYIKPTNAELKVENESLKQQLDFVESQPNNNLLLSSNKMHEGKVEDNKEIELS